ncbi:MAG: YARHG domain-containing protein [Faecalibacillus sp.]
MICPRCKSEIRDDALFCSECGAKIEKVDTVSSRVGSRVEKREQEKKKSNKNLMIIIGVVVVLALVAVACYFLFFKGDDKTDLKDVTTETKNEDTKKIKLKEDDIQVIVGEIAYIEADMDCTYQVKDDSICSVDSFGTVKGLKEGSTTVTCIADNKTKVTCKVTVEKGGEATEISGDYVFPNSSTVLLTENDLTGKSEWELRIGINEIYARHHCTFKTQEIVEYFSSKSWYSADPNITSDMMNANVKAYLNDTEIKNVNFIRTYQQSH